MYVRASELCPAVAPWQWAHVPEFWLSAVLTLAGARAEAREEQARLDAIAAQVQADAAR